MTLDIQAHGSNGNSTPPPFIADSAWDFVVGNLAESLFLPFPYLSGIQPRMWFAYEEQEGGVKLTGFRPSTFRQNGVLGSSLGLWQNLTSAFSLPQRSAPVTTLPALAIGVTGFLPR